MLVTLKKDYLGHRAGAMLDILEEPVVKSLVEQDVITKLEPETFRTVTGLEVKDFHLLVRLKIFITEQMNQAVFAFRRYEDASLRYTGIESHDGLTHYGLYDTVVAKE